MISIGPIPLLSSVCISNLSTLACTHIIDRLRSVKKILYLYKGAIIFIRRGALCLWGAEYFGVVKEGIIVFFSVCKGGGQKKLVTSHHKQTPPLPLKMIAP